MLGVAALPSGLSTYTGGILVLLASIIVLVASHLRTQARPIRQCLPWACLHDAVTGQGDSGMAGTSQHLLPKNGPNHWRHG